MRKVRQALRWGVLISVSALLMPVFSGVGQAAWPEKAIQWVVVFPPGGGTDTIARIITPYISRELGVPVNVINKPGGNQIPAINYVMKSPPDGYILLQEQQAASAIKAALKDMPIDIADRTFGPLIVGEANAIVVNGKSPWNSLKDMVAFMKEKPEEFIYWRSGGSSFADMVAKVFFQAAGLEAYVPKFKVVDVRGSGPGNVAVAGGHIMMGGGGAGGVVSLVQSGDIKALAVTGSQRVSILPNVPTAEEAGYPIDLVNWYGVSGPKGLPDEVMKRLDEVVRKLHKDPAFIADLGKLGQYPFYKSPEEARPFILKEAEFYKKLAGN